MPTATEERAGTAISSTSSGKQPHDEDTTACERDPQRERIQPSQTPQHRATHPQQQSKTRAETAVYTPPFQCTTASARQPQRERTQLRMTPQSRTRAAQYNPNNKRETEKADTVVCRNSSTQRCVHSLSTENMRYRARHSRIQQLKRNPPQRNSRGTHRTCPTTQQLK